MKRRKLFAVLISISMMFTMLFTMDIGAASAAEKSALDYFKNPDYTAKPMARMWFPDATAGMDDNDTIEKQILELADAGFGGVEVAMLSDGGTFTNEEADVAGWGTENWVKLLKKVYKAAAKVKDGFVIDLTITAHWPPCINTIDPNDSEASHETSIAFTKVKAADVGGGTVALNRPTVKTADGKNAPFVFTDTLVSAALAKVTAVTTKGSGTATYAAFTVEYDSITSLETAQSGSSAAGIPDEVYFNANKTAYNWTGTYASAVVSAFGPDPVTSVFPEKIDGDGNRKRLADTQYDYDADLSGIDAGVATEITTGDQGNAILVGDYVAVGVYYRGTGQNFSGGSALLMKNRPYVPDYFDKSGMKVVRVYLVEDSNHQSFY